MKQKEDRQRKDDEPDGRKNVEVKKNGRKEQGGGGGWKTRLKGKKADKK